MSSVPRRRRLEIKERAVLDVLGARRDEVAEANIDRAGDRTPRRWRSRSSLDRLDVGEDKAFNTAQPRLPEHVSRPHVLAPHRLVEGGHGYI